MKNFHFLLLLLPIIVLASCNKDDDEMMGDGKVLADCTYMKAREGTVFTYDYLDGSVQTLEVIEQKVVDGNELIAFRGTNGDESYLNCEGEMLLFTAEELTSIDGDVTVKNLVMDWDLSGEIDDEKMVATINNVTTTAGYTFTQTVRYFGKVVSKGLSREVSGVTYDNVIEYHLRTTNELSGIEFPSSNTIYFIAPEVAWISFETRDVNGYVAGGGELSSYVY